MTSEPGHVPPDVTPAAPRPGPPDSRPGRRGGARSDVLVILGTYLVLGLVCGVLWWVLVQPAAYTKLSQGGSMSEVQLSKQFDADGWYTVLALVAGLLSGGLLTWWRSRDFLRTTLLVAVGSVLAAVLTAWTGHLLGPGSAELALRKASLGAQVPIPLDVSSWAPYLAWPIAALAGELMVLWSSPKDTER